MMHAQSRPGRSERWRALGILLGVLALAYLLLLHPWWTRPMLHLGDEIKDLGERDARVQALLQQAPEIAARLSRFEADSAAGFMPEANVQLATAALVRHLETTVQRASPGNRSCAISNRTPLADPRPERFARALVQVRLVCGNAELATVLHALEHGHPRLFVDNLNIIAQRQSRLGSSSGGLDVSFELYGYLQPDPGADVESGHVR